MSNIAVTAQHFRQIAPQAYDPITPRAAARDAAGGASSPIRNATRTLAVTGGKGGVGKTNLSVALALCAARAGLRVCLLDADFGLAKIHVLLGLSPRADLRDVLSGAARLGDTLIDGPEGVRILPGASGLAEIANLGPEQRGLLLQGLEEVSANFDLLLVDTGAGISENVLSFVVAADEAVVVTTPEPTALTDAYALIKVVAARRADVPFHLLINNAVSAGDGDAAARGITDVARRFLSAPVSYLGSVPADPSVGAAVGARKPYLSHAPQAPASAAVVRIAVRLVPGPRTAAPSGVPPQSPQSRPPAPGFARRLASLFGRQP